MDKWKTQQNKQSCKWKKIKKNKPEHETSWMNPVSYKNIKIWGWGYSPLWRQICSSIYLFLLFCNSNPIFSGFCGQHKNFFNCTSQQSHLIAAINVTWMWTEYVNILSLYLGNSMFKTAYCLPENWILYNCIISSCTKIHFM